MPNWGGGASGAAGGALTGAKLGSMLPGLGTGIGAAIGGIGGGLLGLFGGGKKNSATGPSQAFRQRAMAPVQGAYGDAQRNISRQSALQGGYSPGMGVLTARLARQGGQALSDAAMQGEREASEYDLRNRATPSNYQNKLSSIGGTVGLIGQGAGAIGSMLPSGGGVRGGNYNRNMLASLSR